MKTQRELQLKESELRSKIEELRKSQEELETSRNTYAFLYDFAPVGYFTFDPDGIIRSVNQTGERLLSDDHSSLIDQNFEHYVSADDCFVFSRFLRTVFTSGKKETCRLQLIRPDQQPLYVRIEAQVTDSGAECLAVLVDITEKKLADQALAESEYNLAKAQEMTQLGSWSFDPATGKIQASTQLLRILRLRPEETTQEAFASVVHPDDYHNVMHHLRLGIEQGRSYEIEHRLKFADGSERWVYSIIETMANSAGTVQRLYGTTQDITARKQAEDELQNKTNELQAIFDSICDGIIVYDHEAIIQHHNLIGSQFLTPSIEIGKSCREIFHPESSSHPQNCPVEIALQGKRVDISMTWHTEEPGTRYLDVTATPIRDAVTGRHRALVFLRDVTEKRLQEMHLIQAEKMSSIGVLATGIAHEINNPLTSVAGCAEALQRRFRDEPGLEGDSRLDAFPHYLQVIVREVYRCKGIIDHLLSFSRTSEGSIGKVDLNLILLEIIELLKYQPGYQQVEVVPQLQPDLPAIIADPSGLRQVFMNLLVNAHQSIEERGRVEVRTEQTDASMLAVVIRDNGCGMSEEIIERIWEPFFTTKEVGRGVGLGLALTYNIVMEHGGDIQLTSKVGKGSEFVVSLPISPLKRGSKVQGVLPQKRKPA